MSASPESAVPLHVRAAGPADLQTVLDFRMGMLGAIFPAEKGGPPWDRAALRQENERWLAEHLGRDCSAWLAEIDGEPAGTAAILWFPHPPGPRNPHGIEAYILNVYTRPEFRRLGVARALMTRAIAEARATGVSRIWLRASDEGRPLYEELGFGTGNYMELSHADPDRGS